VTLGSYHTPALLLLSLILSSYLFSWAGPSILHHMIEKSSSASNLRTRGIFTLKAYRYLVINIFAHGHNHIREKNASKEKSEGKRNAMEKINIHPKKKNSGYQCRFVMVTHYLSNMICFFFSWITEMYNALFRMDGKAGKESVMLICVSLISPVLTSILHQNLNGFIFRNRVIIELFNTLGETFRSIVNLFCCPSGTGHDHAAIILTKHDVFGL